VSEGSLAEKLGIRDGDVIRCVNGKHISTTVEVDVVWIY
jgi:S1-C subfamily serine protease